jgi:16S rRNA (cytidine1402-2'-O)-methyltransferase
MEIGKFYVVATPIGNLEDITFRAIRTLKEVDLILAEDTRKSSILLKHYEIKTPMQSYHAHTDERKMLLILNEFIAGKSIALITDAGTPGISDPGNELISYLLYRLPELEVIPVPGASSLTAFLSICGLNVAKFSFLGFLPKKKLKKELERAQNNALPFVFFESPYRIEKTMQMIHEIVGSDVQVVIGRELTKMHEEVLRGTIEEVKLKLATTDRRGEYVVLVIPQPQKSGLAKKSGRDSSNDAS